MEREGGRERGMERGREIRREEEREGGKEEWRAGDWEGGRRRLPQRVTS